MAVGVDDGEGVVAFFGDDFDLVLAVSGLPEVGAVEVPVEGSAGVAVGGREDDALAAGVEGYRRRHFHPFLGIDDFHGAGGAGACEVRVEGREGMVVAVGAHVVPFLRRGQDEAGDMLDFGYGPAVAVNLPGFVGVQMDQPVVGAGVGPLRSTRRPDGDRAVGLAQVGGRMAAEAAAFDFFQFVRWHLEPTGRRQQAEEVEHHGGCVADAGQQRSSFTVAVANPDTDDVVGRHADAPGVAVAVARARLPGHFSGRMEGVPVAFLLGTVDFRQGVEGAPGGAA